MYPSPPSGLYCPKHRKVFHSLSPQLPSDAIEKSIRIPEGIRWAERSLKGIFINFINTSTERKDSFIDLNIKITCTFFAFSQRG